MSPRPAFAPLALALACALPVLPARATTTPATDAVTPVTADDEAARKSPELEKVQVVGARSPYIVDNLYLMDASAVSQQVAAAFGSQPTIGEVSASPRDVQPLSGEALAVALLVQNPKWSNTRIAAACGCNRTTLNTWPKFMAAREMQKRNKDAIPRGRKDAKTGDLEAWDSDT